MLLPPPALLPPLPPARGHRHLPMRLAFPHTCGAKQPRQVHASAWPGASVMGQQGVQRGVQQVKGWLSFDLLPVHILQM